MRIMISSVIRDFLEVVISTVTQLATVTWTQLARSQNVISEAGVNKVSYEK